MGWEPASSWPILLHPESQYANRVLGPVWCAVMGRLRTVSGRPTGGSGLPLELDGTTGTRPEHELEWRSCPQPGPAYPNESDSLPGAGPGPNRSDPRCGFHVTQRTLKIFAERKEKKELTHFMETFLLTGLHLSSVPHVDIGGHYLYSHMCHGGDSVNFNGASPGFRCD